MKYTAKKTYFCPLLIYIPVLLKKILQYTLPSLLVFCLFAGCSFTRQNNWYTRNSHALRTHYNIAFNGNQSYYEGIDAIAQNNVDDYTQVIPLFPISHHENASAATSQMQRAQEKAEKAIKNHSIRKKPKKKQNRSKDPKYQAFMQLEEYNSQIDEAWILLGKAQFHQTEFLAAVGTFTYIIKYFKHNRERVAEAQIWLARSYAEMDWLFEANDVLNEANRRPVPNKLTKDFAAARGDLLLKQHLYKEAIPYVEIAAEKEKNKRQRTRFRYVLAQLYALTGDKSKAVDTYSKVIKANPPFEMDFQARLARAQATDGNTAEAIKPLRRMLRSSKYAEHKDRIYFAIGKIHQAQGENDKAIENYLLALKNNQDDEAAKVQISVQLADLYYTQSEYLKAQPLYSSASALMHHENPDYKRVNDRALMLGELNRQHEIVVLQDSLQALSLLDEEARREKIEQMIKQLQDEEIAQRKREAEEAEAEAARLENMANAFVPSFGNTGSTDWYFYNPSLTASGKQDFRQRWGSRKLEDNWRRTNKNAFSLDDFGEDGQAADPQFADDSQNTQNADSLNASSVNADPQFYLKQIPTTVAQRQQSDEQIADALFAMGIIYKDDLEDLPMAIATFEELERRFPKDARLSDAYFYLYQISSKKNDTDKANYYRLRLISQYPESLYAKVLSDPAYAEKMAQMNAVQDSLYRESYFAYTKNDFTTVGRKYNEIRREFPLSPLMPKFMFLNALSEGKRGNTEVLITELEALIEEFPQSDVNAMSKDILALVKQGNEIQAGSTHGSMLALRDSITLADAVEAPDTTQFSPNRQEPHLIVITVLAEADINQLQFNVATYNFTGFLVKNFDLEIRRYNAEINLLIISMLEDYDEALWYEEDMRNVPDIKPFFDSKLCTSFVISQTNFELIKKGRSIEDYLAEFYNKPKQKEVQPVPVSAMNTEPAPEVEIEVAPQPETAPTSEQKTEEPQPEPQKEAVRPEPKPVTPQSSEHFTADPTVPHAYGILITKGAPDFELLKDALERYNEANFSVANLQITRTEIGEGQLITVGMLPDANAARSYLSGVVRQRELFAALRGTVYRNVVISSANTEALIKTQAFEEYMKFSLDNYIK